MKKMARDPQVTGILDYIWTVQSNMMLVSEVFESRYRTALPKRRYESSPGRWEFGRNIGRVWFTAPLIEKNLRSQEYAIAESLRAIGAILWNTFHIFHDVCKLSKAVKECDWLEKGRSVRVVFLDGSAKIYRPIKASKRKKVIPPDSQTGKSTGGGPKT